MGYWFMKKGQNLFPYANDLSQSSYWTQQSFTGPFSDGVDATDVTSSSVRGPRRTTPMWKLSVTQTTTDYDDSEFYYAGAIRNYINLLDEEHNPSFTYPSPGDWLIARLFTRQGDADRIWARLKGESTGVGYYSAILAWFTWSGGVLATDASTLVVNNVTEEVVSSPYYIAEATFVTSDIDGPLYAVDVGIHVMVAPNESDFYFGIESPSSCFTYIGAAQQQHVIDGEPISFGPFITTSTLPLGMDGHRGIFIEPELGDNAVGRWARRSFVRAPAGRLFGYAWANGKRKELSVRYISSAHHQMITSWWLEQSDVAVIEDTGSYYLHIADVDQYYYIVNDSPPVHTIGGPHNDLYSGVIELEGRSV